MDEILTFSGTRKLNLAAALKRPELEKPLRQPKAKKWASSQSDSSSCDEDDSPNDRRRRRRKRGRQEKESVASRLKHQAAALDKDSHQTDAAGHTHGTESSDSSGWQASPPPSPIPSPPPLVFSSSVEGQSDPLSKKVDQVLLQLKQPQCSSTPHSEHTLDVSSSSLTISSEDHLTLRVRCRGKIHRFTVDKIDPLSLICKVLGKELGVKGDHILLSHHATTLDVSSSPASLGLTTADIIDAVVLDKEQVRTRQESDISTASLDLAESITIKVQSSNKSIAYSLGKMDALGKAMTAFAAALDVPVNHLRFTFDGDPISPQQTPNDLEMDHEDIVDARLLS